jgi:hypothetical protein
MRIMERNEEWNWKQSELFVNHEGPVETEGDSEINIHCGFAHFVRESNPFLWVTNNGKGTVLLDQAEADRLCPPGSNGVYYIQTPSPASGQRPKSHYVLCEGALPSYSESPQTAEVPDLRATILELKEEDLLSSGDHIDEVVRSALSATLLFELLRNGPLSEGKQLILLP